MWKERTVGPRKQKLMEQVYLALNAIGKKGLNPTEVARFLKIDLRTIHQKYTTKQLTGVIGKIKEFDKVA
jgi:hypothetical protein